MRATADGRVLQLRDVARIELGALSYAANSFLLRRPAVALLISQRPGSNALGTAERIRTTMQAIAKEFPPGLAYDIAYDPTGFIAESVSELITTIEEAILLVVLSSSVPAALAGCRDPDPRHPRLADRHLRALSVLGYSINNLTLFGLVLAVGIVVDDAIVVVENVEHHLAGGKSRGRRRC